MSDAVFSLVPLLICGGASALLLSLFRRLRRRAAARTALVELDRREPLPAPDEDLAIHRVTALLDAIQIVEAEFARVAPLYDEPSQPAPSI